MERKIELLYVDREPLEKMGRLAGICWNAPLDDREKNRRRAIDCIKATHWRVMEFVDITVVITGFSARCLRELYTHIGGSPTRLQESTRYVAENGFGFYTPAKCEGNQDYEHAMNGIRHDYDLLIAAGIPREDAANVLPLGMDSKMVWKVNLRTLVNFFNRRLCSRALKEIRDLAGMLRKELSAVDDDWKVISDALFVPMCEIYKWRNPAMCFCQETRCCGRHPKLEDLKLSGTGSETTGES